MYLVSATGVDRETIYTSSVDVSRVVGKIVRMCAWCRKIESGEKRFVPFEKYVRADLGASVSHGICPECEARNDLE